VVIMEVLAGAELLHRNGDFEVIARHVPLRVPA